MASVGVIGGGVAGLTAAGLLAKRGQRVVLFEQRPSLGGKAATLNRDDLVFDLGPTLLAMPYVLEALFDELGAQMPRLHRLKLQCRYTYPHGAVFDAHDDLSSTCASAEALHPGDGQRLAAFYRRAEVIHRQMAEPFLDTPFDGFAKYVRTVLDKHGVRALTLGATLGTLDALARSAVRGLEVQQFISRFATYTGASPYRASAALASIAHLERAFGVHHPEGGMGELVRRLAAAVVQHGVEFRLNERVTWRRDRTGFVVVSSRGDEPFDQLIVNSDPTPTHSHRELSLSAAVFSLRVPRRLDLPHHTISFSADYAKEFAQLFAGEIASDPTLYICHPAITDPTMARPNATALYAMVNAPAWRAALPFPLDTIREQVLERVGALVGPCEVVAQRGPAEFASMGAPGGALYGAVGHGRFGPFRRPRIRGPGAGLFYAGGGTHPGGGVPLVALSGRFAAELALREVAA